MLLTDITGMHQAVEQHKMLPFHTRSCFQKGRRVRSGGWSLCLSWFGRKRHCMWLLLNTISHRFLPVTCRFPNNAIICGLEWVDRWLSGHLVQSPPVLHISRNSFLLVFHIYLKVICSLGFNQPGISPTLVPLQARLL